LCRRGWKKNDPNEPPDHALGRSRGGFSTKAHITCDGQGHPLNVTLSPGQTHETQRFTETWDTTEVFDETLKYLVQPAALAGDKAYRSGKIVEQIESEGVTPVIPEVGKKANDADHPNFDHDLYGRRNVVERLIGWLKESRRVFSRFEKTALNYLGMIHVACICHYLAELV
jgi:transposase